MRSPEDLRGVYERAEADFREAARRGAPRAALAAAAGRVTDAARTWEAAAYPAFFAARDRLGGFDREVIESEIEAERAELLAGLWSDLAEAFGESA